ncbi:MAG: ABC transporter permease [Lachnospiraceae bacterium]|nr:ABC transporter permease [Lachnospiraceae bacterium]
MSQNPKFTFVQDRDRRIDEPLVTNPRSYLGDALVTFRQNRSSVAAAWILLFLILFAVFAPILSPYSIKDQDRIYTNYPSILPICAKKGWSWMGGAKLYDSQNDASMLFWEGIAQETGMDPVIRRLRTFETPGRRRGEDVVRHSYDIRVNAYYAVGNIYQSFSYKQFEAVQRWQDETGIQVIYPYVHASDIHDIKNNPNLWYQVNEKGVAQLSEDGHFVPVYATDKADEGAPYDSLRIPGDDGSYIYSIKKSGAVQCRVNYYNYYRYKNGHEPVYIFGTSLMGMDLFGAIGMGARFSLLFALLVAGINMVIGILYGSLQGYYGGAVDMILDRVSDILSGVPFVVVATLFQLHLSARVGVVPSFLFAFVLTGWISVAALTRKQFYRFKGREFVLAARALGASDKRLMFVHILPNAAGTLVTSCALVIPAVISSETALSYLGIVDLSGFTGTTLGTLLSQGNASATTAPNSILWPSLFLGLLMISFNLFGNGLRDAFNPETRGTEN